ncbi:M16 family metallopeptidase [Labrys okinawensis]|uniref:M16 family metallopeptidase n=1 Tax=Labrys okinawensis TaxID=346911 RepID=UPI0039BC9A46
MGATLPARAEAPSVSWPQTASDLQAESGIRFGTLSNGMRFAVMHNATPAGQAAIRFRIGSGSLEEDDSQQGLAHFLEHMAFKGSTHVAEGEMVRILQRKGLAFGPDTNAHTSYDETVYALDLPEVDAETVSTGLMLMRETASELKLDAGAFDRERGVILSEERLRDTPQYRGMIGLINVLLAGLRVPQRPPIGKTDIISHAPVDLVRDYYRANYRPDRATLMVVGDVDPDAIEAEIRQRFDDWKPAGPVKPEPDVGALKQQGPGTDVVTVPGASTRVQVAWTRPYDASADNFAKRRAQTIEDIGLSVLKRRVGAMARRANAPFISAEVASQDLYDSARIALIAADSEPGKWQTALAAIDQEQRRIAQFGVEQAEIDREILEYRSLLQAAAGGAATRTSTDIANTLAQSVDDNKVFTSPADDLALFERMVKGLTAEEVNQALHTVFSGNGPRLVLQTAQAPEGGADAVAKAYAASRAVPVTAPPKAVAAVWPYIHFGNPGTVVERRGADDLGVTMVRFANDVRLNVKPTKLRANEVLVRVDIGHGRLDLPKDRPLSTWTAQAVELSGLKGIDYEDMQKALAANVASIDFSLEDASFKFEGRTRPEDLATQLQVLAAYSSDPAYRPEVFARLQQAYLNNLDQYAATPSSVVSRDFQGLVHADDPRWAFPDREQLLATKPGDFEALFHDPITRGAIEVTVVGDVTADDAIRLVSQTFGALPARPDGASVNAVVQFPPPVTQPVLRTHTGRADNAAAVMAVPVGDMLSDLPRAFAVDLAGQIFENRLIDQFRIAEGATYSPQGDVSLSKSIPGYGFAYAYVETTPAKVDRFFALVDKIATDLAATDVSPDELARAREPTIETVKHQQEGNEYWLQNLRGVQTDPRRLDLIRQNLTGYEKVTAQDIRTIAATYFRPEKFWKFEVLPSSVAAVR